MNMTTQANLREFNSDNSQICLKNQIDQLSQLKVLVSIKFSQMHSFALHCHDFGQA